MIEIKPPSPIDNKKNKPIVFFAGSINGGNCFDWQNKLSKTLSDYDIIILNPRRSEWHEEWIQSINNPNFKQQVTWEMDGLEIADIIVMYFDASTKSPISLFELGLHAKDNKLLVCCPDGFWRKGNVEVACDRFKIPLFNSFDELLIVLKNTLDKI